jgi:phosphatidate cytidylyltransferase
MLSRIVSALVLGPATLALVIYAPPRWFLLAIALLGTLCLYEFYGLTRGMGLKTQAWFGYTAFWWLMLGQHFELLPLTIMLSGLVPAGLVVALGRREPLGERVLGLMATLFGPLYLVFCLYPAKGIRFGFGEAAGVQWLMLLLAVVWAGDIAALFAGRALGRTKFSPRISPNKTNEGALAGLLAGLAVALILQRLLFLELPLFHVLAASLLVGIFAQLGDLAESMLKRAAGAKDSSNIIPGHGGILDRIDGLLFALPVLYLYLYILYQQ